MKTEISSRKEKVPFLMIIKQCWLQLLCVFLLFFVTLTIFPAIQVFILREKDSTFFIGSEMYVTIMCFLTFNVTAFLGSLLATFVQWVSYFSSCYLNKNRQLIFIYFIYSQVKNILLYQ